jgi:hypothetical protein
MRFQTPGEALLLSFPVVQKSRFSHQTQAIDHFWLLWCRTSVQNHPMIHGNAGLLHRSGQPASVRWQAADDSKPQARFLVEIAGQPAGAINIGGSTVAGRMGLGFG